MASVEIADLMRDFSILTLTQVGSLATPRWSDGPQAEQIAFFDWLATGTCITFSASVRAMIDHDADVE